MGKERKEKSVVKRKRAVVSCVGGGNGRVQTDIPPTKPHKHTTKDFPYQQPPTSKERKKLLPLKKKFKDPKMKTYIWKKEWGPRSQLITTQLKEKKKNLCRSRPPGRNPAYLCGRHVEPGFMSKPEIIKASSSFLKP